jgi:hypothetical protein
MAEAVYNPQHRQACSIANTVGLVVCLWFSLLGAADAQGSAAEICSLTPGLLGRIESILPDQSDIRPTAYVKRGDSTGEARVGCFVQAGDLIRPGPGTTVRIKLPDRRITTAHFGDPIVIPALPPPSSLGRVITLLKELAGADGEIARQIVVGRIGATRSPDEPDPPITIPSLVGLGPQSVDRTRLLGVQWQGGTSPYYVKLISKEAGEESSAAVPKVSERYVGIDLTRLPLGNYELMIAGQNSASLAVSVHLVAASEVPSAPGIDVEADADAGELVAAVWLLTRAPTRWRLEALSQLELLARERDNVVSQSIIDPDAARISAAERP